MQDNVTVVAIVREEDHFLDEWLAYHHLLGVEKFVLYDDDPRQNLVELVHKHRAYVTVVGWTENYANGQGRNRQTQAYENSLQRTTSEWIAFIDIDEFIVLRKHGGIAEFLAEFPSAEAVVLQWHLFGHNGYYKNPCGLITQALTRRQDVPGEMMKSIVRRGAVLSVPNAHMCHMRQRNRAVFDANYNAFTKGLYPGKTDVAHVNHYMCRSFENWMGRVKRGEVAFSSNNYPRSAAWRYEEEACLKRFVKLTRTFNEKTDEYMLKYGDAIRKYLEAL